MITFPDIWFIVKILLLVALFIYIIFAIVVVKQVKIMNDTLDVGFEGLLSIFSFLHLAFAVIVFLIALTTL